VAKVNWKNRPPVPLSLHIFLPACWSSPCCGSGLCERPSRKRVANGSSCCSSCSSKSSSSSSSSSCRSMRRRKRGACNDTTRKEATKLSLNKQDHDGTKSNDPPLPCCSPSFIIPLPPDFPLSLQGVLSSPFSFSRSFLFTRIHFFSNSSALPPAPPSLPPPATPTLSADHPNLHSTTLLAAVTMTTTTKTLLLLLAPPFLRSPASQGLSRSPSACKQPPHSFPPFLLASMQLFFFPLLHLFHTQSALRPPVHRRLPTLGRTGRKTKKAKKPTHLPVSCAL